MQTQSGQDLSSERVHIPVDRVTLHGDLVLSSSAGAVVLLPQGIADESLRAATARVAESLQRENFATLSVRLLTPEEEDLDARTEGMRFDVNLLSRRLIAATWWLKDQSATSKLPIGYFAVSTDAAAALVSAADATDLVDAVVAVSGRPDLAGTAIPHVIAPTLFVVAESDQELLPHNKTALAALSGEKKLECIAGTQNLIEAPEALARTVELARNWFKTYLLGDRGETRAA